MPKGIMQQMASGSYVGTTAAVEVQLGFQPRFLLIFNQTDGDVCWISFEGMAAGKAIQIEAAVSHLASNGISLRNSGFTAGTSLSESGDTFLYLAIQ